MANTDEHKTRLLTISEMARRLRVSPHTLRYYESEGLLCPSRTAGGQRRYREGEHGEIQMLIELREAGMTIAQLRGLVEAQGAGVSDAERLELLMAHQEELRGQIAFLRRHLRIVEKRIEHHRGG